MIRMPKCMPNRPGTLLLLLLLGPIACADALSPAASPGLCGPGTVLTVSGGVEPIVSWSPPCRAAAVTVEALPHGISWHVVATGNSLLPPIRHGQPPEYATELQVPGGPLLPGIVYTVTLQRYRTATARDTLASSTYEP